MTEGQFPSDIFDHAGTKDYQTYSCNGILDEFVFRFPNGKGAIVSKPAGLYKSKINIWDLKPIKNVGNAWINDPDLPTLENLVEVDIPKILFEIF